MESVLKGKKALATGDLHLRPSMLDLNKKILDKIYSTVLSGGYDYLMINGDIFHTKNETYESVKHQFRTFLKEISKICKVVILVGNHDWAREHTIHSLEEFGMIAGVTVVDSYYKIENIGFMAYARSEERFLEMISPIKDCDLIFGHFAVNEFDLGTGYEEVDLWCSPDKFAGSKKIISGHWHKMQVKKFGDVEFLYVGSPSTVDHGESNQKKYFASVNLETLNYELIDTGLTLHKTLKINAGDEFPTIPDEEINYGVDYRVIVRGTKEQLAKIKIPPGYKAKVDPDLVSTTEKREIIDAYSGPSAIIDSYISKKKTAIRNSLIARGIRESDVTEEVMNKYVEKILNHAKSIT